MRYESYVRLVCAVSRHSGQHAMVVGMSTHSLCGLTVAVCGCAVAHLDLDSHIWMRAGVDLMQVRVYVLSCMYQVRS